MQSEELKPCPFCGYALTTCEGICEGYVDGSEEEEVEFTGICCPGCAVFLPKQTENGTAVEGIQAWNRRAEAAMSAAARELPYHCDVCTVPGHGDAPCSPLCDRSAPSVAVKALEWATAPRVTRSVGGLIQYTISLTVLDGSFDWELTENDEYVLGVYKDIPTAIAVAQADYEARIRSALSAQVQDVAGTVEAFDKDHPELYWHIAKGKITAGEPLYGAIITDIRGNELGHGESDVSAADAFNIAVSVSNLPAAPAKQEGGESKPVHNQSVENGESGDK